MATFIELDMQTTDYNVTVGEIEVHDATPRNILRTIATSLVGKTIADVKGDPRFTWWTDPVTDDTVIVSAFATRV